MGLDVSLDRTGIAFPDGMTTFSSGGGKTTKRPDGRLSRLYDDVYALAGYHRVTHAILEDLPINAMGAGATGQAQGVVRLALQQLAIPFVTVVASTLKKYATGSGGHQVKKPQMRAALPPDVSARIPVTKSEDEVDAWFLWRMGMDKIEGKPVPDAVKWEGWGL
jgi:Holliday junction resolvasome RuvABC endonuclease subunit